MKIPAIIPLKSNRIWRTYTGGKQLDLMEGKALACDSHFPEDWIASTTYAVNKGREQYADEGLASVSVDNKEYLLKELMQACPEVMLGKKHFEQYGAENNFLLKFLDSSVRLHIQCHPTVSFSREFLNDNAGKTEGYVILGTRDEVKDPYIYMGFQRVPEKEEFKQAILRQDTDYILSCFDKIPVKPGDVFLVPGGVPHAIGEGVLMMEIMEPTDYAVRIEFERAGYVLPEEARFMGRDVEFAMSMFDFSKMTINDLRDKFFVTPKCIEKQGQSTLHSLFDSRYTDCFNAKQLNVSGEFVLHKDYPAIAVVTKGRGIFRAGSEQCQVSVGDRFFIPYATEKIGFQTDKDMDVLIASR